MVTAQAMSYCVCYMYVLQVSIKQRFMSSTWTQRCCNVGTGLRRCFVLIVININPYTAKHD